MYKNNKIDQFYTQVSTHFPGNESVLSHPSSQIN